MSSGDARQKRTYDATRRRQRAEAERRATRTRVLEAASTLFVANGYAGTTMAAIAKQANVAMQSVYSAGRSKADLLHEAVQLAVAGDDEPMMIHQRPVIARIAGEPDPVEQARMIAAAIVDIHRRSAGIQRAQIEAAAIDPTVRERAEQAQLGRLATLAEAIGMIPSDRLRHSAEECTDTLWVLASPETFDLLQRVRGWDWDTIAAWLERASIDLLLKDSVST
jgi:AcrR family transcriptional regulator